MCCERNYIFFLLFRFAHFQFLVLRPKLNRLFDWFRGKFTRIRSNSFFSPFTESMCESKMSLFLFCPIPFQRQRLMACGEWVCASKAREWNSNDEMDSAQHVRNNSLFSLFFAFDFHVHSHPSAAAAVRPDVCIRCHALDKPCSPCTFGCCDEERAWMNRREMEKRATERIPYF